MTIYHSGFQKIISVPFDNSLVCSFISLHTCLIGCDHSPGTFIDTAETLSEKIAKISLSWNCTSRGDVCQEAKRSGVRRVASNSGEG